MPEEEKKVEGTLEIQDAKSEASADDN